MRALHCLGLLCILIAPVVFALPKISETELLAPQLTLESNSTENNDVHETLDYPWWPEHDKRPDRRNHLDWRYGQVAAYCLHVQPGYHKRGTPLQDFLGSRCTSFIHKFWGGWELPLKMDCVTDNMTSATSQPEYRGYMGLESWDNPEHCRAGCETCFDAMMEYGVEEAFCGRSVRDAHCTMAVWKVNDSRPFWQLDDPTPNPTRRLYYGKPKQQEMWRGRVEDTHIREGERI